MPKLEFSFSPRGPDESYEMYDDGESIGLVWKSGDQWFADPHSKADPLITAASREEAGRRLQALVKGR